MQKPSQLRKWLPELYLFVSALSYWISTSTLFNPFGILLLAGLIILFVFRFKPLGVIISLLFLFLSLYMLLALWSELSKFPSFDARAQQMLALAGSWLGLNIVCASFMLVKWGKDEALPDIPAGAAGA